MDDCVCRRVGLCTHTAAVACHTKACLQHGEWRCSTAAILRQGQQASCTCAQRCLRPCWLLVLQGNRMGGWCCTSWLSEALCGCYKQSGTTPQLTGPAFKGAGCGSSSNSSDSSSLQQHNSSSRESPQISSCTCQLPHTACHANLHPPSPPFQHPPQPLTTSSTNTLPSPH